MNVDSEALARVETLAQVVAAVVRSALAPVQAECERLRRDIATLRDGVEGGLAGVGDIGVWHREEQYQRCAIVTHDDTLWGATEEHELEARPRRVGDCESSDESPLRLGACRPRSCGRNIRLALRRSQARDLVRRYAAVVKPSGEAAVLDALRVFVLARS